MPPEIRDRIFEPFFTTKPVGEGTGLGLDISWRIVVNKHHGDLRVESVPGDTRFQVRLPLSSPRSTRSDAETRGASMTDDAGHRPVGAAERHRLRRVRGRAAAGGCTCGGAPQCGHIGCCDTSPSQHATAHAAATGHPVIRSFEPGEDWFWSYETGEFYDGPRAGPAGAPPARPAGARPGRPGAARLARPPALTRPDCRDRSVA